jgi:hypothetical protein
MTGATRGGSEWPKGFGRLGIEVGYRREKLDQVPHVRRLPEIIEVERVGVPVGHYHRTVFATGGSRRNRRGRRFRTNVIAWPLLRLSVRS